MPSPTVLGFFKPVDFFSLAGYFIPQSNAPSISKKRAQGLKANGDEGIYLDYALETKRVDVYEYQFAGPGSIVIPNVGQVIAAFHIDSIDVEWSVGWPKITINSHQHAANAHSSANTLNLYVASIALPAQFGVPRSLVDLATPTPADVWKLGANDTSIGVKSLKYSISCVHLDEDDGDGSHLAGENRDGVEKLDISLTGIPASVTIAAGWSPPADNATAGNTAADGRTLSYEKHILRYVAP